MKAKIVTVLLLLVAFGAASLAPVASARPKDEGKAITLNGKVEETEAKAELKEPNFGYVGCFGTFQAAKKGPDGKEPHATFVVHHYPH